MSLINKYYTSIITRLEKNDNDVLVFFIISAIILRILSFFYSVIDHDESTYLLIGRELAKGKILYIDVWDTKPPGIFLIFGLFYKLFGSSIFLMRLTAAIATGLTAYFLFKARTKLSDNRDHALITGILYMVAASAYRFCLAANTELFFNLFTAAGLVLFLSKGLYLKQFISGLIIGCGFIIKYVTLLDLAAFIIFMIFIHQGTGRGEWNLLRRLLKCVMTLTGFIIPFALVNLWYLLINQYDAFYLVSFGFISRYHESYQHIGLLNYLYDFHLKYLPLMILFYYVVVRGIGEFGRNSSYSLSVIWFLLVFTGILMQGKSFNHYFIQLFPSISMLIPELLIMNQRIKQFISKRHYNFITFLTAIIFITAVVNQSYYLRTHDYPRQISGYLRENIQKGDKIFTTNYRHIIYYLLDLEIPTKYVHPSLLTDSDHINAANINASSVITQIIHAEPRYVIIQDQYNMYAAESYFKKHYLLRKKFGKNIFLYEHVP